MSITSWWLFNGAIKALPKYKGVMTWSYSQTDWTTWFITRKNAVSANGICEALSAQWIVDHAYGGSLRNRMTDANDKLSESAIRMITQNFVWTTSRPNRSQDSETEDFLRRRGIVPRQGSRVSTIIKDIKVGRRNVQETQTLYQGFDLTQVGGSNVAFEISKALPKVVDCYAMISFGSATAGHATAAWIGARSYATQGDAAFFDPNAGEFWFEDKRNFFEWFKLFYQGAYQRMNHHWSIRQFALSVAAEKSQYGKAVFATSGPRRG